MRARILLASLLAGLICAGTSPGIVPHSGGGRPAPNRGGGGGLPSMSHAAQRPAPRPQPAARPGGMVPGGNRPNYGAARPNIPSGMNRPSMPAQPPNVGAQRPNLPTNRPSLGQGGNNAGLIPQNRPGGGTPNINRPGAGNLPNITQRPSLPNGVGANRPGLVPGTRPNPLPGGVGSGNRPGLPGGIGNGNRPELPGGNRPGSGGAVTLPVRPDRPSLPGGGGDRPGLPSRPGGGDQWTGWRPGDGNRPNLPDRPGAGGGGVQWPNRPDRPGAGGGGVQWPNRPDRPGAGGGEQWPNRPDRPGGGGSWAGWRPGDNNNNRPNWPGNGNNNGNWWNNNRPIVNRPDNSINNNININHNQWNTSVSGFRGTGWGWNNSWVGRPWYSGFYQGSWNNWPAPIAAWTTATANGWLYGGDNFAYSNPYYVQPTTIVQPVYNYSEPIAYPTDQTDATYGATGPATAPPDDGAPTITAPPAASDPAGANMDPKSQAAMDAFTVARDAFKAGDFAGAQVNVEKAIGSVPNDPVLHEFRALTLFAQGKYTDAAATLYAVLSRGPGWDWATMKSLYPDAETYTKQLRALEAFIGNNRSDSAARFVLAYHYLVMGQTEPAVRQLQEVVKLTPGNQLAADMVKALTSAPTGNQTPKAGQ